MAKNKTFRERQNEQQQTIKELLELGQAVNAAIIQLGVVGKKVDAALTRAKQLEKEESK